MTDEAIEEWVSTIRAALNTPRNPEQHEAFNMLYPHALEALDDLLRELKRLRTLTHCWNVQASRAGVAGSEYIDDPGRVFKHVKRASELARKLGERTELKRLRTWAQQVHDALDGEPLPQLPDEAPARIERLREAALAAFVYLASHGTVNTTTDALHEALFPEAARTLSREKP